MSLCVLCTELRTQDHPLQPAIDLTVGLSTQESTLVKKKFSLQYQLSSLVSLLALATFVSPVIASTISVSGMPPTPIEVDSPTIIAPVLPALVSGIHFHQSLMTTNKLTGFSYYNNYPGSGFADNTDLSGSGHRYLTAPSVVPLPDLGPTPSGPNYISANYNFGNIDSWSANFSIDANWSVSDSDAVYTESVSKPSPIIFSIIHHQNNFSPLQYKISMEQNHTGDASLLMQASLIGMTRDTHQLFNVFDISHMQDGNFSQTGTLIEDAIYIYTPLHGAVGNSGRADGHGRIDLEVNPRLPIGILQVVPEPETWAMLLAGLGLTGWMARRRKAA